MSVGARWRTAGDAAGLRRAQTFARSHSSLYSIGRPGPRSPRSFRCAFDRERPLRKLHDQSTADFDATLRLCNYQKYQADGLISDYSCDRGHAYRTKTWSPGIASSSASSNGSSPSPRRRLNEWEDGPQPARFVGRDWNGAPLWSCIGIDGVTSWPMRSIGGPINESTISVHPHAQLVAPASPCGQGSFEILLHMFILRESMTGSRVG